MLFSCAYLPINLLLAVSYVLHPLLKISRILFREYLQKGTSVEKRKDENA